MNRCYNIEGTGRKGKIGFGQNEPSFNKKSCTPSFYPVQCSALLDDEIIAGSASAEWHEYGHDAELEWCLIFSKPLSRIEVTKELECTLQGAIRERMLCPVGKEKVSHHRGGGSRSIIAMDMGNHSGYFGGVDTNLAEIFADRTMAAMALEYQKENGKGTVHRRVSTSILASNDLEASLKRMQLMIAERKQKDINIVRLHTVHRHGGYLQERWLKYQSALTAVKGVHFSTIATSTIRSRLMSDVIERREYIQRGTEARLNVVDASGKHVGRSVLKIL